MKNVKGTFEVPAEWADFKPRNKAFREGYVAFITGRFDNPYNETRQFIENREWQRGWNRSYKTRKDECDAA